MAEIDEDERTLAERLTREQGEPQSARSVA